MSNKLKGQVYALNKILSEKSTQSILNLNRHHWGTREIQIKKLIVLINRKPREEFNMKKNLTLKELIGYISYFEPSFSREETQNISNYFA